MEAENQADLADLADLELTMRRWAYVYLICLHVVVAVMGMRIMNLEAALDSSDEGTLAPHWLSTLPTHPAAHHTTTTHCTIMYPRQLGARRRRGRQSSVI